LEREQINSLSAWPAEVWKRALETLFAQSGYNDRFQSLDHSIVFLRHALETLLRVAAAG
jgi:hypothetical protein